MDTNTQRGYVGLIVILITVAIIGLLYAKTYLSSTPPPTPDSFQPMTASGTPATTGLEQMHADIDAAKAVQNVLDKRNAETNAMLGSP